MSLAMDEKIDAVSILGREAIFVGHNMTTFIARKTLEMTPRAATYVFMTDKTVESLHLKHLIEKFDSHAATVNRTIRVLSYSIPPGEGSKTRATKEKMEDFLLSNGCTRDTCLIALGGGVIGDMVGFVAATFMRGITVFQIPTTLLAMVDSSIGGKTAVDTPAGKNLIGSFHQPTAIFIDVHYLSTLPRRQFINGMAEVIKTAAIWDIKLFEMLEEHQQVILPDSEVVADGDQKRVIKEMILSSVKVKAHVVSADEKESGLRSLLNFGHTIGHAIEAILAPEVLHGECVAVGMAREAEISKHLGFLDDISYGRLCRCLHAYGLPLKITDSQLRNPAPHKHCRLDDLLEFMKVDKKNVGAQKRIVLLSSIGCVVEKDAVPVSDDVIRKILAPALKISLSTIPTKPCSVAVPGSKSISNRALLLAALGQGRCRLHGLLFSDDVHVMLDALQKLSGISYTWENQGKILVIDGASGRINVPSSSIYLGNAGTAARFLTTVATLAQSSESKIILTGNNRMKQRPIGPLVDALNSVGCQIEYLENSGSLPLRIAPTQLSGGTISLSASVSSQYVSSILMAAPYAKCPVLLDLDGDAVVSQPYIDMTIAMMKSFGIFVTRMGETNKYQIPIGCYKNPTDYYIEGDASSATYPLAFAAVSGATVTVTNIGSESLQGDSEFPIKVLKQMGCNVEQTPTSTTVTGPSHLSPLTLIDMETMTDAFLTASVLAAVADGFNQGGPETNIVGIANQRVKECNRIAAMVEQLSLFGVRASELPDGIKIHGMDRSQLKHQAPESGVYCYDDHRIAMSFSILACAVASGKTNSVLITEKRCVEKTWPSWWSVLEGVLGADICGVDVRQDISHQHKQSNTSIILIGMRGAGKTSLGKIAASALGRQFIDMDYYFEQHFQTSIPNVVQKSGWTRFREMELECFQHVTKHFSSGAVISCGGGIVETIEAQNILKKWPGLVISITRSLPDIIDSLTLDNVRPILTDDLETVWSRRKPLYAKLSDAEFVAPTISNCHNVSQYWNLVEERFVSFLNVLLGHQLPNIAHQNPSFFVSLTYPNISHASHLSEITEGVNAVELRVDLLESYDIEFVASQVALLRHQSPLPIIFTVRSLEQGGKFQGSKEEMFSLLKNAIRWGCEFVDVEVAQPYADIHHLYAHRRNTKLIASFHDTSGEYSWDGSGELSMLYKYEELYPFGDIIKLIGTASSVEDNNCLWSFRSSLSKISPRLIPKPLIALNMGHSGKLSRVLNTYMTPVTHEVLPASAAPGQLTLSQIHQLRVSIGMLRPRQFFLFGSPINQSLSPILHNTGFHVLGLPHQYSLFETDSWIKVQEFLADQKSKKLPLFGGASVTIPLKVDIIEHGLVDRLTDSATSIGSVNTLFWDRDGTTLVGDNTDWIGIRRCFESKLRLAGGNRAIGIVIGGGGTARAACYALEQSQRISTIRIWNRTAEKAKELSKQFSSLAISSLKDLIPPATNVPIVIISTIPSSAQESLDIESLFSNGLPSGSVFVELAYRPRCTPMVRKVSSFQNSSIVEGIEVLLEQGYEQFHLWTKCVPPIQKMRQAVYDSY